MSCSSNGSQRAQKRSARATAWSVAGLVSGALLLTGCVPTSAPDEPTNGTSSGAVTTPAPIVTQPGPDPSPISTDAIPGLNQESASQTDQHIFYRWFSLAGHSELADAQRATIRQWIDTYTSDLGPVDSGGVATPELNIQPVITAATQDVLGVRLQSYEFMGASGGTSFHTIWYFLKDHKALNTKDLFKDQESWERMLELTKTRLSAYSDVFPEAVNKLDEKSLNSLNFDSAGNGLVELNEYEVAPGSAGPQIITIPAQDLQPLLNAEGQAARTAGMSAKTTEITNETPSSTSSPSDAVTAPPNASAAPTQVNVDCAVTKCIALTFDDGPGPYTQKLLDDLNRFNAKATFFVVGSNVDRYEETLRREAAEGHEIGNHSWSHRALTTLSEESATAELESTADAVTNVLGYAPQLVRPPYGATSSQVNQLAHTPVILWSVDTQDWKSLNSEAVVTKATQSARPGAIVLMHDIHSSTVDAVPEILKRLSSQGYKFVTVSQLLSSQSPAAGVVYSNGPTAK